MQQRSDLNYYQQENLTFVPTITGLLSRCGPYLLVLDFGSAWFRISPPITQAISEYCNQIRHLDLSCAILCSDVSVILDKIASQLIYFSIEESNMVFEENAEKIGTYFKKMKKLKEINLRKCRINMNYILDLPEQLEVVDLSSIHHLDSELIACFLVGHPKIRSLTMSPFPGAQFPHPNKDDPSNGLDMVFDCISSMQQVTNLNLGHIGYDSLTVPLNCLSRLTKLRSLELRECLNATEHSLKAILTNATELESLTVINCSKICDYSSISACSNLKQLTVEKSYHVCDDDLKSQFKLEKLKLKQCYNITNSTAQLVSVNCPIRELDLSFCNEINDQLFEILCMTAPLKLKKLLLDGCKITHNGVFKMCLDGKHLLKCLIELDFSHNKTITNKCIEKLILTTSKIKRIKTPLKVFLSQCGIESESFAKTTKRVELIF
ncbi:hypothetical protein M3Y97_00048200 [Aphelenchoides bicaudatus]|nr:hypothetical protein M3Y97_00048200 [Aphelenchoides bicaudatus]